MLIGVFKSNQKIIGVLVILLTIILWLPAFFMDLNFEFHHLITTNVKWLDIVLSIFLIAGQAIYLNIIVNEFKLIKDNSQITSLIYLVFCSGSLFLLNFSQIIIANTFILITFHQLLRMYNLKNNLSTLFNSGLLIGIASLIYLPCIVYFVLLWATLIYTTTPKWRDFMISLIGLSIPLIYLLVYKFVFGNLAEIMDATYLISIFDVHWKDYSLFQKLFFVLFTIITLLAFMGLLSSFNRSAVRVKKMLVITILMAILGLTTLFLNQFDYLATFLMVVIPVSIIVSIFFQNLKKSWLAETIFFCLFGIIVLGYFS